jgi:hypothetical protein
MFGFVQLTSDFSWENFGFVQWTSAFLGVSSNRGQTLKIALFYKQGTFGRKKDTFGRKGVRTPWIRPWDLLGLLAKKYSRVQNTSNHVTCGSRVGYKRTR